MTSSGHRLQGDLRADALPQDLVMSDPDEEMRDDMENVMDSDQIDEEKSRAAEYLYNTHLDAVKEEVELI